MKTCTSAWSERLGELGAKVPTAALSDEVKQHLVECEECAAAWDRLRSRSAEIDRLLAEMVNVDPSQGFQAQVLARAVQEVRAPASWRLWSVGAVATVAVLVLAVGIWSTFTNIEEHQRESLASAESLIRWRSPTAGLLHSSSFELFTRVRLGEFYFLDPNPTEKEDNHDDPNDS